MRKTLNIIALLLLGIFLISFASALNSPDWSQYSPQYSYITNTQDSNSQGYFNLNHSMSYGSFDSTGFSSPSDNLFPTELVTRVLNVTQYSAMTDGGYLSVYNPYLIKQASILSGNQVYSLSLFATSDKKTLKIAGIFTNSTGSFFSVYDYQPLGNTLTLNSTTGNVGNNPSGVRCVYPATTYFNYNGIVCLGYIGGNSIVWNISTYYDNGTFYSHNLTSSGTSGQTPRSPSFIDANNDGLLEVLGFNEVELYYSYPNGTVIWKRDRTSGYQYSDADFFKDTSSTYKIAYTENYVSSTTNFRLSYLTLGGATFNGVSGVSVASGGSNEIKAGQMSVLDWTGDGISEIAVPYSNSSATTVKLYDTSGSVLKTGFVPAVVFPLDSNGNYMHSGSVISAKLNGDGYYDMILNSNTNNTKMFVLDLQNNVNVLNASGSFIPVDYNGDGVVELLGYNTTKLTLITSNYTNQNAVLNSLTFVPSTTPAVSSPMTVTLNASDTENDIIYYYVDCGNGQISESTSNTRQCTYTSTGDAWFNASVRDEYHSTPLSSYATIISVGGVVSNQTGNQTNPQDVTNGTGGIPLTIPTELVNTSDTSQGLLPEIYYGLIGFFSESLSPIFILAFTFFIVMLILLIAVFVKRVAHKISHDLK